MVIFKIVGKILIYRISKLRFYDPKYDRIAYKTFKTSNQYFDYVYVKIYINN